MWWMSHSVLLREFTLSEGCFRLDTCEVFGFVQMNMYYIAEQHPKLIGDTDVEPPS